MAQVAFFLKNVVIKSQSWVKEVMRWAWCEHCSSREPQDYTEICDKKGTEPNDTQEQVIGLRMTEIYDLTILEARSLKSRYQGPCSPWDGQGHAPPLRVPVSLAPSVPGLVAAYPHLCLPHQTVFSLSIHTAFPLWASLSMSAFSLFIKTSVILG